VTAAGRSASDALCDPRLQGAGPDLTMRFAPPTAAVAPDATLTRATAARGVLRTGNPPTLNRPRVCMICMSIHPESTPVYVMHRSRTSSCSR